MLARFPSIQVTVIDRNLQMLAAMTALMCETLECEYWINADWLAAPLRANSFHLVLGDCIFANIPPDSRGSFVRNVHGWLKPNGAFVTRVANYKADCNPPDLGSLLAMLSSGPITETRVSAFLESSLFLVRNIDDGEIRVDKLRALLADYETRNRGRIRGNKRIRTLLHAWHNTHRSDGTWWSLPAERVESCLSAYFAVEDKRFDPNINMPQSDYGLIYRLARKGSLASEDDPSD